MMYNIIYSWLIIVSLFLLLEGCANRPPQEPPIPKYDSAMLKLGEDLALLVKNKRHEEAIIRLNKRLNTLKKQDCLKGFENAGGLKKEWDLILQAANSYEFEAGKNYGAKLLASKLQDADVVEYIRVSLKNASNVNKLAFYAGFISAFKNVDVGRNHLDTLWLWATSH